MIATRTFVQTAIREFNRMTADELSANLANVSASNLSVLRDAVRAYAATDYNNSFSDAMTNHVVDSITAEINRRWA